jgi:hypothetical protein
MADQASLRLIGLAFGAVTAAVTLMAAVCVVRVEPGIEPPLPTAVLATSAG